MSLRDFNAEQFIRFAPELGIADPEAASSMAAAAALGLTEDALALDFTAQHGHELRHVAQWNRWLRYERGVWRDDARRRVFDLARALCREKAASAGREWLKARIASAHTVAAIVKLASADPTHARGVEDFDRDPFTLNTPDGVVDLRSGTIRDATPDEHHTKQTAVAPGGACPTWEACLDTWTAGDHELIAFLQRLFGYSLTGSTRDHVLPFFYGTGANGKSVCLNTVRGVLGDYAATASTDTFTAAQGDRHPADLAMLRGLRFVIAQEVEQGRRWDEARLKALTGGDPITARFMRGDFFEFIPTFKVAIAANHKPALRNVDEAIRRRLLLVPFVVTIPAAERDPRLPERLRGEWPGILAWMIRGALAWQAEGLRPPACVLDASESYFAAEDAFTAWLEDDTIRGAGLVAPAANLFASWKGWAEARGEWVGSQKHLAGRLEAAGFESVKDVAGCRGRGYRGLGLRA